MAADYVILSTSPTLNAGTSGEVDEEHEFTLPAWVKSDSKSILFYAAYFAVYSNSSVMFNININTKQVLQYSAGLSLPWHSYHAVIPENLLKADRENNIEFEVKGYGSGGSVSIKDVVLLMQQK